VAFAESQGKEPGGDIMIHGHSYYRGKNKNDWTAGCIAVRNREMEDIYAMVKPGTPILILP
jgi:lipoprotein-anchoring transpeptidase ErfK/SrfK